MYEYNVNVVRVVDGDTVDVDIDLGFDIILKKQRIRLSGIDAPESRTRDLVEKQFGLLAKEYVAEFLTDEKVILKCKNYDSTGKYGRILGDLYVEDVSLCESMINGHLAVEYTGQNKSLVAQSHLVNRQILIDEGIIVI
jgi:micrococcal nuclease